MCLEDAQYLRLVLFSSGNETDRKCVKSAPPSTLASHYFSHGSPVCFKDFSDEFISVVFVNAICLNHDEACTKRVLDSEKEFVSRIHAYK